MLFQWFGLRKRFWLEGSVSVFIFTPVLMTNISVEIEVQSFMKELWILRTSYVVHLKIIFLNSLKLFILVWKCNYFLSQTKMEIFKVFGQFEMLKIDLCSQNLILKTLLVKHSRLYVQLISFSKNAVLVSVELSL